MPTVSAFADVSVTDSAVAVAGIGSSLDVPVGDDIPNDPGWMKLISVSAVTFPNEGGWVSSGHGSDRSASPQIMTSPKNPDHGI